MSVQWTNDQQQVIDNRGGALLVSAAAGSGKTAVLVQRVLQRIVCDGCDIDAFLIVTYTRAAAAEMRGKIADALTELVAGQPQNAHLRRQLMLVHRAQITTVHAYCMSLLREQYNALGLTPDFGMADDSEVQDMQAEVLEDVLEQQYAQDDEGFALLAEVMGAGRDDRRLRDVILEVFETLQCAPRPDVLLKRYADSYSAEFADIADMPWGRQMLERASEMVRYGMTALDCALDEMESAPDVKEKYEAAFLSDLQAAKQLQACIDGGNWDAAVQQCRAACASRARLGAVRQYPDPDFLQRLKDLRALWKSAAEELRDKVLCLSEDEIREDTGRMAPAVRALCALVQRFAQAFAAEKRRRSLLDFHDLEHFALELLVDDSDQPTQLARDIHFTEIMVDEYQDTNAVQDAIFRALSDDERNLFLVGDVKQSIYRFRQANPAIFLQKYKTFTDAAEAEDGKPRRIVLSQNFRSRPQVLESVNTLFRHVMSEQLGDLAYTDREALHPGAVYPDSGQDCRTELILLETGSDDEDAPERIALEADFCAHKIQQMLAEGFQVTDKQSGQLRPCRPEDFVILMRSLSMRLPVYQKALQRCGIAAGGEAEDEILHAPEILTVLSLLDVLDNPHQDLPLLAVLRSPLFGFTEQELADIRLRRSGCDFFTVLRDAPDEHTKEFCERLADWRVQASDLPVHELLWLLMRETDAMAVYGAMPNGKIRQRNLSVLLQRAAQFDAGNRRGLFAFVRAMRQMREQDQGLTVSGAPDTADAVRIMTIHKSKGLEFPIVLVADCSKQFNETDLTRPVLLHEQLGIAIRCRDVERGLEYDGIDRLALAARLRQENVSEELRVLYVAMTRAKEKLILTASFDNIEKTVRKWELLAAMQPTPVYALQSVRRYSDWLGVTMLCHPSMELLRALCVTPPGYRLEQDDSWAVQALPYSRLGAEIEPERLQAQTMEQLADSVTVPELTEYAAASLALLPSKLTATAIAKGGFLTEETAEGTQPPRRREPTLRRPFFRREDRALSPTEIGTAHHLFLQFCRFDECRSEQGRERELARLRDKHILSAEQADAISLDEIGRFFASDLFARMDRAKRLLREFKFSVLVPAKDYFPQASEFPEEEVLLQGVVDCLFETEDGFVIVDFKTDRVRPGAEQQRAQRYAPQLDAYRRAVHETFDRPVTACALYFLHTGACVERKERAETAADEGFKSSAKKREKQKN